MSTDIRAQYSATEYYNFGKNKFDQGKFFECVDFLDKAIKIDSLYENAIILRGRAFLNLSRFDLALHDFNHVINNKRTLDITTAELFLFRALAYIGKQDYPESEEDIQLSLELRPFYPEAYYEYARLKYLTLKDKSEAILMLDRAIQVNPDDPRFFARRAEYKASQAKYNFSGNDAIQSAIRDISFAISLEPDNYDYYQFRSELNKQIGEPEEAVEDYDKMIELNPDKYNAYSERGIIKMQFDDYQSAIIDFTSSITRHPEEEKNYRLRGLCRYNISDFPGAYDDFTKAIQLLNDHLKGDQKNENFIRILADTYLKRGVTAISMGNSFNGCADFRAAYQLGSAKGFNYQRKYCGF